MLLQLALARVDAICDYDFIACSDETARRTGNPYAKRKFNMADPLEWWMTITSVRGRKNINIDQRSTKLEIRIQLRRHEGHRKGHGSPRSS